MSKPNKNAAAKEVALTTQLRELSARLNSHLQETSSARGVETFFAAEAEKLHMEHEVVALKHEISTLTDDLKQRLDLFQTRASEELDKSLECYNRAIHGALVDEELLKRAADTGFKQLLEGYRGTLLELSAAVDRCEKKWRTTSARLTTTSSTASTSTSPPTLLLLHLHHSSPPLLLQSSQLGSTPRWT